MDQGDWKRLEDLFHRACELPLDEREAFAREQAGDHAEMLTELLAMLAMEASATAAVNAPIKQIGAELQPDTTPPAVSLHEGARLGPWQVDKLIGSGGMGQVYLGHRADGSYERQVAIKTIGTHGLSAQRRAYFEFERHLLAQMQHPAIAQIIDAGSSATGQLYLVMEYVEGKPLMSWCESRALPLRERIGLFVRICEGVQHAHQKGVIHRDLKPGNILICEIDGKPAPKIIDFGIAAETSGNHQDRGAQVSAGGTPGYMSPEQGIAGMDIDSRSDVYSLGAMLYELISGRRPKEASGTGDNHPLRPSDLIKTLGTTEIANLAKHRATEPKQLLRTVRDDLDWIVVKAMQHDREQRYGSVSALIDDLIRWLHGYVPRAAPQNQINALRKFVARNKLGVAAGSLALFAILAGLTGTTWALHRANQAAQRAQATRDFLANVLSSVDPDIARDLDKTLMLKVLEEASSRVVKELADQPEALIDVEHTIADSYAGLGDAQRSVAHLESALAMAERSHGRYSIIGLDTMWRLGLAYSQIGDNARAEELLREALPHAEKIRSGPDATLAPSIKARLSWAIGNQGRAQEALELASEAWNTLQKMVPPTNNQFIDATLFYSTALAEMGEYDGAITHIGEAISTLSETHGMEHPRTLSIRNSLAVYYLQKRDYAAGERELKALLEPTSRQYGPDSTYTLMLHANLGGALRQQGTPEKISEAGPHYRYALDGFNAKNGPENFRTIVARHNHANWLLDDGQVQKAHEEQLAVLEIARRVLGEKSGVTAEIHRGLAEVELKLGNLGQARAHAERALELKMESSGDAEGPLARTRETLAKIAAAEAMSMPVH